MKPVILPSMTDRYRPDIDGLRALAVLSILFFHCDFTIFKGGFVGVDVFFVISGFLITRNILHEVETKSFSWAHFYERRVRRLFPALFFTLCVTFVAGAFLLSPQHLERLGQSVFYALGFSSNFFFYSEAGYFDTSADFKPLLHMWSLAVEEQFYLLWPALLLMLFSFRGKKRVGRYGWVILFAVGLLSLICSEYILRCDPEAAFYLLPFRIFEFVVGALCVWLINYAPKNNTAQEAIFLAGIAFVLYPIFFYTTLTPFPGLHALLPCLGAGMVIYSGTARYSGIILRNRMMVGIGLVSYSLYLIHWPLIIYYRYWKYDALIIPEKIAIVVASLFAATLMYFYIEQPFRRKPGKEHYVRRRVLALTCGLLALMLAAPALHAHLNGGWSWRLPSDVRASLKETKALLKESRSIIEGRLESGFYEKNETKAVIIGDSFANDMLNAIEQNNPRYPLKRLVISADCQSYVGPRPLGANRNLLTPENSAYCDQEFQKIIKSDDFKNAELVIFAPLWEPFGLQGFSNSFEEIRRHTQGKIIVFGPRMAYDHMPTLVAKFGRRKGLEEFIKSKQHSDYSLSLNQIAHAAMAGKDLIYVDVLDIFCPDLMCPILTENQRLVVWDGHHWTLDGAALFGLKLKQSNHPAVPLLFKDE